MKITRRVDVSELDEGTVILVDTTDDKTYKLVLQPGEDHFEMANVQLTVEDSTEEKESDIQHAIVSQILIGKPMSIVIAPEKTENHGAYNMKQYQTAEVKSIEVYS